MAANNYAALSAVETKQVQLEHGSFTVQFNPERHRSTGAKVDAKSIAERPCFLCAQNRPKEQLQAPLNDRFEFLVNPFPIFKYHYTLPSLIHEPQRIMGNVGDMLEIAKQLTGLTVFYNGPFCGASAPDHLHFQAYKPDGSTQSMYTEAQKLVHLKTPDLELYSIKNHMVNNVILTSLEVEKIEKAFHDLYSTLSIPDGHNEPMMNVLACFKDGQYYLQVIPRKQHRPQIFYASEETRIRTSPACVDLTGLMIIPYPEDFKRANAHNLQEALNEVCMTHDEFTYWISELKKALN